MAGWDGDALAGSMEEALERQQEAAEARRVRRHTSPQDFERKASEESSRLNRARIEEQLGRATNPAHRAMLERALSALEAETASGDEEKNKHSHD
jgi:hypothetical protein